MIGRRAALAVVAACALAAPRSAGAASFSDEFRGPARALGRAFADTVARSLPVTSASPGITFTYDTTSGAFERNTELLGQLYLERARPIGRGKWNVAASYQRVHIDSVQGQAVDSLRDNEEAIVVVDDARQQPGAPRGLIPIKYDRYDVDLTVNEVTLAATYGITDDLDVNLTLPILVSALAIDATGRAFKVDPNAGRLIRQPPGVAAGTFQDASSNATGVGDLFLRGKYRFLARPWGELATGLVLRMPTGNRDDFQGTGDWELSPLLYANTRRFPLAGRVAVQLFANAGLDLNIDDVGQSQGRYGVGADFALADVVTLSLAFLGREPFQGFTSDGFFDVPRYRPSNNTCQSGSSTRGCPTAPLFGLETVRPSYYSLSLGGRVNMWRDTVFGFANVLIPLSNQGIHTDVIPLVGVEATF
jgi:hypothetical protein